MLKLMNKKIIPILVIQIIMKFIMDLVLFFQLNKIKFIFRLVILIFILFF
jgi:hypothetical protein